ncbi:MAG: glycosyltransferase [Polyangiales bacterium]
MTETILYVLVAVIGVAMALAVIGSLTLRRSIALDISDLSSLPLVSVLLTCRNEEAHLTECLQALAGIDYPASRLQFVLVDDGSTDSTFDLLSEFARTHSHAEAHRRPQHANTLKGKARGVAFAATKATGEWIFITDADARVPCTWIRHMLGEVDESVGGVGGAFISERGGVVLFLNARWIAFKCRCRRCFVASGRRC